MKLKKRTRKQLLRLVAIMLFVAMIINSAAPTYASDDFVGRALGSLSEGAGTQDNIMPASMPEPDESLIVDPTEEPTAESEQSLEQDAESAETPEESDTGVNPDEDMPSDEELSVPTSTELGERVISSTASDNAVVKIDGLLPEGATISVDPTEVDLNGQSVLAAYDITILDKEGTEYKITDPVTVTISGISDLQKVFAKNVNIYHMENEYAEAERISGVSVSGDSVTFTANSFSVYAVTVSTTMTMDDAEGGRTVDPSYDSYISINDKADKWDVTLTKADNQDFDPNGKYSREIEFTFKLTYEFDNNIHPDINRGAYFQLPDYLEFMDDVQGDIIDESEGKKVVGRYEVIGDKIYFTFTDSKWLEEHKSHMEGDFTFNVKVSSSASENKSQVDVVFPGDSDTTTIYFEEGKVEGNKTGKLIEGGKYIEYTITLEVKDQDVTGVTLTDMLGDGLTFVDDSFTLTRIDDEGNVDLKKVSISGNTCTIEIGDLKIGKYELKYRVEVDYDKVGENATNQVTWKWDGGKEDNSKNANVHIQKHQVGKYGQVEGDRIKWQIAVTPDQLESVAGTTIIDTLGDGLEYEGTLYIYESDNIYWYSEENLVAEATIDTNSKSFEYTFTDGKDVKKPGYEYEAGAIYFIVYYTKITNTGLGTYTNHAKDSDDEGDGTSWDVPYTPSEPSLRSEEIVKKEGIVVSEGNPEEEVIHWTITIEPSKYVGEGKKIGNLTLRDKNPNYGYNWFVFVEDSLTVEYEGIGEAPAGDYKLVWNEDNISFTIEFTKEFTIESPNIIVSYTAKLTEGKQFSGWVDNQVVSDYEIDGEPRQEPDDGKVPYYPDSGSGSGDSQFSKTGEMNGLEVEWTIKANWQADEWHQWEITTLYGEYTIEDILPEGMEFVSATYVTSVYCDLDAQLDFKSIEPTITEDGKLIFTFNFDQYSGANEFIILKYKTIIDELEAGERVGDSSYSFTNSAEFKGKDVSGKDSDTVTYTKKILDKYGTLSSGYYDSVDYTILINYDAVDLLDDGDWLTLVDTLDPNTALDLDSLMVTDYETGEDITDSCQISYDSSGKQGKLIVTVPDGRALVVTYRVDVFGDAGEEITITNNAELRGVNSSETSAENTVIIRSSSAGASGESAAFKIRKIDKNNIRKTLEGAKFNLYKWSDTENDFVLVNSDPLTTDDKGDITFGVASDDESSDSGKLYTDTLYMYEEVDAPNGYIKDTTKHYFILKGKRFNEINLAELEQKYGEIACYDGGITVYVANEANPTFGFSVKKTDEGEKPLSGAVFTLTKMLDSDTTTEDEEFIPKVVEITDRNNGTKIFDGLLPGTYVLTETTAPDGYKKITETYTIIIGEDGNITYKKGNVTLSDLSGVGPLVIKNEKITGSAEFFVEKTYENWDDEEFTFVLKAESYNNSNRGPMPKTAVGYSDELQVNDDEFEVKIGSRIKATFGAIVFDQDGDYYYTIKEKIPQKDDGISYDTTRYYIWVHVANNNEENPTEKNITIYYNTDGWVSSNWTDFNTLENTAEFENLHKYDFSVKKVDDASPSKAVGGATFTLTKVDADSLEPDDSYSDSKVSADVTGKVDFTGLLPGTYLLSEESAPAGYTKSGEVYLIKIAGDGKISYKIKDSEGDFKELTGDFLTVENGRTKGEASLFVQKSFTGWEIEDQTWKGEKFSFTLEAKDADTPMPADSTGNKKTIDNVGDADEIGFGAIEFKDKGTYFYKITENVPQEDNGITYDNTVYYVKVVVSNGAVGAEEKVVKVYYTTAETGWSTAEGGWTGPVNGTKFTAVFNNEHNTSGFSIKKVNGTTPLKGAEFTLTKKGDDKFSKKLTTQSNGTISFDDLLPGEYTLKETKAPIGYENAGVEYTIRIAKDGTVTYKTGDGEFVKFPELLEIQNAELKGYAQFSVKKTYEVEEWANEEFTFELQEWKDTSGEESAKIGEAETVKVNKDDTPDYEKAFGSIEFTADGTYYYTITEVDESSTHSSIRYDETTYYITVVVHSEANADKRTVAIYVTEDKTKWGTKDTSVSDGNYTVDFTNSPALGDLEVTKTFGENSDLTAEKLTDDQKEAITFTVTGPDGEIITNGSFTYADMLENGGKMTFEDLPAGEYTVTETNGNLDNYTVTTTYKVGADGTESSTPGKGQVKDGETLTITVTNTYTVKKGDLQVTKTFAGDTDKLTDDEKNAIQFIVMDADNNVLKFDENGQYKGLADGPISFTYGQMDDNGIITLTGLPYGTYSVKEVKVTKDGYTITTSYTFDGNVKVIGSGQDAEAEVLVGDNTPTVKVTNDYHFKRGGLTVQKAFTGDVDETWIQAHKGDITFTVTGPAPSSTVIGTFTYADILENNRKNVFENLTEGTYTVTEAYDAVDGYTVTTSYEVRSDSSQKGDGTSVTVTMQDGEDYVITFTNNYHKHVGNLTVVKAFVGDGKMTDDQKANITFTVTGPDGQEIESFTYADMTDGEYTLENLAEGEYTVTETNSNIDGYTVETTYKVGADGTESGTPGKGQVNDGEELIITVTNTYSEKTGDLTVTKSIEGDLDEGDLSTTEKAAIKFTVTGPDDYSETFTYDKMEGGSKTLTGLAYGTYTVTEEYEGLDGYTVTKTYKVNNETGSSVTIGDNNMSPNVTVTNTYHKLVGDLTVVKTFVGDGKITDAQKANITFTVTGPNNYSQTFYYKDMTDGEYTLENLAEGEYTVTETNSDIYGYTVTTTYKVSADETESSDPVEGEVEDGKTLTVTVTNTYSEKTGQLTVTKSIEGDLEDRDLSDDEKAKIKFTVTGPDGYSETFTYDKMEGGSKTLTGLSYGTYTVTEEYEGLDGYTVTKTYKVNNETGSSVTIGDNNTSPEVTVTNTYSTLGQLTVVKTFVGDGKITDDQKANIKFTVTGPDGYEETFTYADMTDGEYTLENLSAGEYTVTETNSNIDGYTVETTYKVGANGTESSDPVEGEVKDGETLTVTVTNTYSEKTGQLTVTKSIGGVLKESDLELADKRAIKFTVTGPDYNRSFTYADMTNGSMILTGLVYGTYTVTEEYEGLDGYTVTTTYEVKNGAKTSSVTIGDTNKSPEVIVTNTYSTLGQLTVVKAFVGDEKMTAAQKANITFTVTGPNNYSKTFTYKDMKDGKYTIGGLPAGEYTVTETNSNIYGYTVTTKYEVSENGSVTNTSAKGQVEDGKTLTVTVTNTYSAKTGQLTVTKRISGLIGELTQAQKEAIKFTVTGPDGYSETFNYAEMEGGSKTLTGLVYGTYTVTEEYEGLDGYTVTTTYEVNGTTTSSVTIGDNNTSPEVIVTNTYGEPKATATPAPTATPGATGTPAPTATPGSQATPTPGVTPVPSQTPAPAETPNPEETPAPEVTPEPTPEGDRTPAPTAAPTTPPMEDRQVLQPQRYQISGTEGMVLGARRGMDYAVLGMRRRPSTGDSVAMLWWLLSLFTALGGCITSGVMLMFGRKKE